MAQDLNQGTLVGRLATEPELRSVGETSVCNFRFAFNTNKKNRATGEWEDVGNFIDVKVWGRQGELVAQYQSKGKRIGISYRLEVETWETEEGYKRSKAVLVAERVQFLDARDADSGSGSGSGSAPRESQHQPAVNDDDDIPF